jgi:outer membrane lipoprotein
LKRRFLLILCFAGVIVSCAPLSVEVLRQVDESLTYQVVQRDPQRYSGKTVLWGGVIIETVNKMDVTVMKVRETELDFEKRPEHLDRSSGRFIVRSAGFLDPAIYKEGREITVAGEVAGKEVLPLGDTLYSYPVILAKEIHLWERRKPYYPYWYDYPYWWYGEPYGWYPYYW